MIDSRQVKQFTNVVKKVMNTSGKLPKVYLKPLLNELLWMASR